MSIPTVAPYVEAKGATCPLDGAGSQRTECGPIGHYYFWKLPAATTTYAGHNHRAASVAGWAAAIDGQHRGGIAPLLANDEHVTGLHRTSARWAGKSYETTQVMVFHVQGDRVSEAWEHPFNIYEQDEVFS